MESTDLKRYYIKKGDKTTNGGVVIEGTNNIRHHGIQLGFLGAQVYCNGCQSVGLIVQRGPRWPGSLMGKLAALEGDICMCKCHPAPVLLASQNDMSQSFETHELASMGYASDGNPPPANALKNFDERIRVVDEKGSPLCGVPYHVKVPAGATYRGLTDSEGFCPRVFTDEEQHLQVAIGIRALQRWAK